MEAVHLSMYQHGIDKNILVYVCVRFHCDLSVAELYGYSFAFESIRLGCISGMGGMCLWSESCVPRLISSEVVGRGQSFLVSLFHRSQGTLGAVGDSRENGHGAQCRSCSFRCTDSWGFITDIWFIEKVYAQAIRCINGWMIKS